MSENKLTQYLEAFSVNYGRARFIVFLLGDPHLLESGQRGQDRSSDPYRVFTLGGSNNLDLHCWWSQGSDFFLHSVSDSWKHGGATRQHCVSVQVFADVQIALHDGVVCRLVDARVFHTKKGGLEQGLGTSESLVADGNNLSVRELVALLQAGAASGTDHFLLKIESNIAQLLFDVTHDLTLGGGGEGVATLGQNRREVVGQVSAGQVNTTNGMGKRVALIDGNCVTHTITAVKDDASCTTRGVKRQHSLDGYIHGWRAEGLKHDLQDKKSFYRFLQTPFKREVWNSKFGDNY